MKKNHTIALRIDEQTYRKLMFLSERKRTTISHLIRGMIEENLNMVDGLKKDIDDIKNGLFWTVKELQNLINLIKKQKLNGGQK